VRRTSRALRTCSRSSRAAPSTSTRRPDIASLDTLNRDGRPLGPGELIGVPLRLRLLAGSIDAVIVIALLVGVIVVGNAVPSRFAIVLALFGFLLPLLYFVFFEGIWQTTPGKRVFDLMVVTLDGERLDMHATITRGITRVPEAGMIIPFIILIKDSPRHQRMGDAMADAVVVRRPRA
jgi:uncharacterized RDD family membrane protein YckC